MGAWQQVDSAIAEPAMPSAPGKASSSNSAMIFELATLLLRIAEFAAILGLAFFLVQIRPEAFPGENAADHYRVAALGAMIFSLISAASGSYDTDVLFSSGRRTHLLLRSWLITGMFLVALGFVLKTSAEVSREWAILWFFGSAGALWMLRIVFSVWLSTGRRRGMLDVRTAVFGGGAQAARLIEHLNAAKTLTLKIVGRFDDRAGEREEGSDLPDSRCGLDALLESIRAEEVDQVIVALPWSSDERIQQVVRQLALTPVRIRLAPDLVGFSYMHKPFTLLGDLPVMTLFDRPISGIDQSVKWLEDQILGWTLLILLSPLLLMIAVAIKLDSPGPVFFRQRREGFNDRQFLMWKFRSMHVEDCEHDQIVQAKRDDPRVTRVGAFLRRTSLDELPQLFNVVRGEMSLVGPRPHAPSTRAGQRLFREAVNTYAARHRVKPGITGWAQVRGWRGITDTEDKLVKRLEHDLYYIEHWSPWFDMVILARTVSAALLPKNAF